MTEKIPETIEQELARFQKKHDDYYLRRNKSDYYITFNIDDELRRDVRLKAFFRLKEYEGRVENYRQWQRDASAVDDARKCSLENELAFYERAAKYYRDALLVKMPEKFLSDWEVGLEPELRNKLRDKKYLPTFEEVGKFPVTDRGGSYRHDFFDHEVWNREYVEALANYVVEAAKRKGGRFTVVEVGAGSGRLSYFLRPMVANRAKEARVRIVAIDKTLKHAMPEAKVEEIDMMEAGEKYKPDLLICSWPVSEIRAEVGAVESANEFIFIGEPELVPFWDPNSKSGFVEYDGFQSRELPELKKWQTGVEKGCTTVEWDRTAETPLSARGRTRP